MKKNRDGEIALIEDHHQAYYAWKERGLKDLPLIHFDAHLDFGFQEVKKEHLILKEARSLADLKAQLEKTLLFKKFKFKYEKLTNIGDFVYPAIRDGIVSEFYWVIPGGLREFVICKGIIKKLLNGFQKVDPFSSNRILIENGFVKTQLYNKLFNICTLKTLPKFKTEVLLDIDTDFLVVNSLKNADATANIGKRKPWITPDKLIKFLKKKILLPKFITIAYSVNGGFTPMIFKTLGDKTAKLLGHLDPDLDNRILAGEYFKKFRDSFDKQDFNAAKRHYREALKLNPKYKVPDNNYGPLYLAVEDLSQAEREFRGILKIDKGDSQSLSGLGRICFTRKKFRKAREYFKKALTLKSDDKAALIGLAEVEFKFGNYSSSKNIISRYEKLEPMQSFSRYLQGQIYEKQNNPQQALIKYKEALQLGLNNIDFLIRVVKLSTQFDKNNLDYLKKRYMAYRKHYFNYEKKRLEKKGKYTQKKHIENGIKRLSVFFKSANLS